MPTVVQKAMKPPILVRLTSEEVRDLLLSLPDNERKFIITDPRPGENKIFSIARDSVTDEVVSNCNDRSEP